MTRLTDIVIADEVLTRARAGCEAAQQEIYAAVAPATLTLIRRLVGQRALAEDIFRDTMMTFYQRLPQFRREARLGAWLRRIAISRRERDGRHLEGSLQPYDVMPQHEVLIVDGDAT